MYRCVLPYREAILTGSFQLSPIDDVPLMPPGLPRGVARQVRPTLDDKASLAVVLFDVLLIDTARGIFFPTLWAHVQNLGGDEIVLGYCVGAFSLGR